MNLIFVGFSGVGKTFWGTKIAQHFNYTFFDTDIEIERIENQSVNDIFTIHGESYFREKEGQIIDQIPLHSTVVATGGGMPCFEDHMVRLLQLGRVIYLKAKPEYLNQNLSTNIDQRPLFHNIPDRLSYIRQQLTVREPFYQQAHIEIDVSKISSLESFVTSINSLYL